MHRLQNSPLGFWHQNSSRFKTCILKCPCLALDSLQLSSAAARVSVFLCSFRQPPLIKPLDRCPSASLPSRRAPAKRPSRAGNTSCPSFSRCLPESVNSAPCTRTAFVPVLALGVKIFYWQLLCYSRGPCWAARLHYEPQLDVFHINFN